MNGTNVNEYENFIIQDRYLAKLIEEYGISDFRMLSPDGEIIPLVLGTKMIPPKSIPKNSNGEELDKEFRQETKERKRFVKAFITPIDKLTEVLSYRDFTWLMKLSQYIDINNGILGIDRGENRHYYSIKELAELINVDAKELGKVIRRLEDEEIIKKIQRQSTKSAYAQVTAYAVSPHIFLNGNYPTKEMSDLFRGTKWDV